MTPLSETKLAASGAFDEIADTYDASFTNSAIGLVQRRSVWEEIDRTFAAGQRILEINCGTGVDALHLAGRGVHVTACDSAQRMVAVAQQRVDHAAISASVDFRFLATERIAELRNEGPFDGILSNFSGLNCIPDLSFVACDLARLVKAKSKMILCLFGCFCFWETVWYASRGDLDRAFRRFNHGHRSSVASPQAGVEVSYHSVRQLKKILSPHFRLASWKGVGIAVPPTYLGPLAAKYPRLFDLASKIDPWLARCPGLRAMADHMLLTFERTEI